MFINSKTYKKWPLVSLLHGFVLMLQQQILYFRRNGFFGKALCILNLLFYGFGMQTLFKVILLTFGLSLPVFAGNEFLFSLVSLDQVTKKIIENNQNKVLGAKTELIAGKKVHVIKVLTKEGRVQYLKVDAESGKKIR